MSKVLKILAVLIAVVAAGSALVWAFRIPIINSAVEVVIDDLGIANASVQVSELDLSSATLSEIQLGHEISFSEVTVNYQIENWSSVNLKEIIIPRGVIDISTPESGIWRELQAMADQSKSEELATEPLEIPDVIFKEIDVVTKSEETDLAATLEGQISRSRTLDVKMRVGGKYKKFEKWTEIAAENLHFSGDLQDERFKLSPTEITVQSEFLGAEISQLNVLVSGDLDKQFANFAVKANAPNASANVDLLATYDRISEIVETNLTLEHFSFTPEGLQPSHFYPDLKLPLLTGDVASHLKVKGRFPFEGSQKDTLLFDGDLKVSKATLPGEDYVLPALETTYSGSFDGQHLALNGELISSDEVLAADYTLDFQLPENVAKISTQLHKLKVGGKGIDPQKFFGKSWPVDVKINGQISGDVEADIAPNKTNISTLKFEGRGLNVTTPDGVVDRLRFQVKAKDYQPGTPLNLTVDKLAGRSHFQGYGASFDGGIVNAKIDENLQAGTYSLSKLRLSGFQNAPWKLPVTVKSAGRFNLKEVTFKGQGTTDITGPLFSWDGQHSLSKSKGNVKVELWDIPFSRDGLQVQDLTDIDTGNLILDGDVGGTANIQWNAGAVGGDARLSINTLDMERDGISIEGVDGTIVIDQLLPLKISKAQTISARRIFAGLPINDPELNFRLLQEEDAPVLFIDRLLLQIFGGAAEIRDGVIDLANETNDLQMNFYKLSLEELMSLGEFEDVVATGALSGRIPLRFDGNKLVIENGKLAADGPGVVKMKSDQAREALSLGGEQTKLLLDILENFNYSHLSLEINKPETGEDVIALSAKGGNPNVENNRPVVLNVNLSTNLDKIFNTMLEAYRLSEEALRATVKDRKK